MLTQNTDSRDTTLENYKKLPIAKLTVKCQKDLL